MATIGKTLGDARRDRDLSIEDVSHHTRIHPSMIRDIEEDDFSRFASVAYAKSFVKNYSDYLEIDLSSAIAELKSGTAGKLSENELMGEMKKTIKKDRHFKIQKIPRRYRIRRLNRGKAPLLLNLVLALLITAMGVFYFLGFDTRSMEEAKVEISNGLKTSTAFSEEIRNDEAKAFPKHPLSENSEENVLRARPIPDVGLVASIADRDPGEGIPQEVPLKALASVEPDRVEEVIMKPDVEWDLDDSVPDPAEVGDPTRGAGLSPRETISVSVEGQYIPAPMRSPELPVMRRAIEEPSRLLRPASDEIRSTPPGSSGSERLPSTAGQTPTGETPVRAIPTASSNEPG
ncbi:MAG: helix-turn-helix domain-containing protein [Verrucomicrobiota bacterium]